MVLNVVCLVLQVFLIVIFARIILSWFPIAPGGVMASIYSVVYNVTEPILGPLRRVIPPLGMFDLSAIIAVIGIQLLTATICRGAVGIL